LKKKAGNREIRTKREPLKERKSNKKENLE
jgi:hypothetical protein